MKNKGLELYVGLFIGIGIGYTKHTVMDNIFKDNIQSEQFVRVYHTFIFLCIKFFWITGYPHDVDINVKV